jgi:hypothetical protein
VAWALRQRSQNGISKDFPVFHHHSHHFNLASFQIDCPGKNVTVISQETFARIRSTSECEAAAAEESSPQKKKTSSPSSSSPFKTGLSIPASASSAAPSTPQNTPMDRNHSLQQQQNMEMEMVEDLEELLKKEEEEEFEAGGLDIPNAK